jgi:L-threonate 2-dehydrogenase
VDIFVKDMGIVLAAGEQAKVGLPLSALVRQMFLQASGMGLGREDDSQVISVYRKM